MVIGLILASSIVGANVITPPARFDHPFPGKVIVVPLDPNSMLRVCHTYTACTHGKAKGKCVIYMGAGAIGTWAEQPYRRHEIAHCNGWPGNHPD